MLRKNRVLLALIIMTGLLVPLVSATDSSTYIYKLNYTFENRGDEVALMEIRPGEFLCILRDRERRDTSSPLG